MQNKILGAELLSSLENFPSRVPGTAKGFGVKFQERRTKGELSKRFRRFNASHASICVMENGFA